MKVTIEVSPKEAAELLQALSEQTDDHREGANSRVSVGENIVTALKGDSEDADQE